MFANDLSEREFRSGTCPHANRLPGQNKKIVPMNFSVLAERGDFSADRASLGIWGDLSKTQSLFRDLKNRRICLLQGHRIPFVRLEQAFWKAGLRFLIINALRAPMPQAWKLREKQREARVVARNPSRTESRYRCDYLWITSARIQNLIRSWTTRFELLRTSFNLDDHRSPTRLSRIEFDF
jgi:hypothetical protein